MPLTLRLAGYNVDADLLRETVEFLQNIEHEIALADHAPTGGNEARGRFQRLTEHIRSVLGPESFTPETISAAYARISRDPKHVTELRRAARFGVARARKSNENIIFGLGHASVAEHACFNFDVSGISRLACEELQAHRLLSFTEKSQRYIALTADWVMPAELCGTNWEASVQSLISSCFAQYRNLCALLEEHYREELGGEPGKEEARELENRSKEDARYLLPLACATQMGMTANARNVEYVVRDFSDHPLREVRDLGAAIHQAVSDLAPSLVKYTQRGPYPRSTVAALAEALPLQRDLPREEYSSEPSARLVEATPDGEEKILRAVAFARGASISAGTSERAKLWRLLFRDMTVHDSAPRGFEVAALTFEALISASCFAQLKRHRLMTLLPQPYDPALGFVLPPGIRKARLEEPYVAAVRACGTQAAKLAAEHPLLAPYLLTNAHRRRVLIHLNARELYHFARLRSDHHAQWEIRSLSDQMVAQARALWPNACALACGKDEFAATYRRFQQE
ncbi:MAG: FAD-dependent thymidylate synthase [bacterium]|nr:FAD-dependent thymidylate synthase [bacterium]